ncbi:MAG: DMSO reductase [Rhodospirillaceae bacterium]|nr:DMSO reductase [Rhodospirillaceae bacterium]
MHPAKSVIFFTTASGAGYGVLILFILMDIAGLIPGGWDVTLISLGVALGLITAGLLSSTAHLGHPERAWRAMSQWRTSWLSREGLFALITFLPVLIYGAGRLVYPDMTTPWQPVVAALSVALALITVYCTAMIYASLRPIPAWSNGWTPVCYLTLSLSSGAVLLNALSFFLGFASVFLILFSIVLLLAGLIAKVMHWQSIALASPRSTAESATGLGGMGTVKLFEAPHQGDNYLMTEMGFKIARKHAARLKRLAILWGFVFPIIAIFLTRYSEGAITIGLLAISVLTAAVGLIAERYLFFAEAKHSVTLFYGESAA